MFPKPQRYLVLVFGLATCLLAACATTVTSTTTQNSATATPAVGVCNAADFPTKTDGGEPPFMYPAHTYNYALSPGAGNHPFVFCSPGDAATIRAFMTNAVTAAGWQIDNTTATTLNAEYPTSPPSEFCSTVNMTFGANASYPGEWRANFHPPASSCTGAFAPTPTPIPAMGVCNAADFPAPTTGGPSPFTYPSNTYSSALSPGAGSHPYVFCSPGDATSILAFMKNSVPAAGWKIVNFSATTLNAENPTIPASGSCYTVNMTFGSKASYPGEWEADFHPPVATCV